VFRARAKIFQSTNPSNPTSIIQTKQVMEYEPKPLGPRDIEIQVTHNGMRRCC
jgi:hypothetical protein